jgi:hypothetical protein
LQQQIGNLQQDLEVLDLLLAGAVGMFQIAETPSRYDDSICSVRQAVRAEVQRKSLSPWHLR